jgi:hypothetical protein
MSRINLSQHCLLVLPPIMSRGLGCQELQDSPRMCTRVSECGERWTEYFVDMGGCFSDIDWGLPSVAFLTVGTNDNIIVWQMEKDWWGPGPGG